MVATPLAIVAAVRLDSLPPTVGFSLVIELAVFVLPIAALAAAGEE